MGLRAPRFLFRFARSRPTPARSQASVVSLALTTPLRPAPPPSPLHSQKELREIERDTKSGVSVALQSTPSGGGGDNLTKLTGYVEGPRDTPYEGGYFVIDIELGTHGEMEKGGNQGARGTCARER